MKYFIILLSLLTIPTSFAWADSHIEKNIVQLSSSAEITTANDQLIANLQVLETGKDSAKLTQNIQKKTEQLLAKIKQYKNIKVKTIGFNTRPRYNKGKISNWEVSQQLMLTSQDFEQINQLLGKVDGLANIQSVQFNVSAEKQAALKKELINKAIGQFREDAKTIAKAFGYSSYKLINISVNQNNYQPRPVIQRSNAYAELSTKALSAPIPLAAGDNKLRMYVSGSIQLK